MTYEIRCGLTGDTAEAETQDAALVAAATLVDDAFEAMPVQGRILAARRSIEILRDGRADVVLTRAAQRGTRRLERRAA